MKLSRRWLVLVLSCTAVLITQGSARADNEILGSSQLGWDATALQSRIQAQFSGAGIEVGTSSRITELNYNSLRHRIWSPDANSPYYVLDMKMVIHAGIHNEGIREYPLNCRVRVWGRDQVVQLSGCQILNPVNDQVRTDVDSIITRLHSQRFTFQQLQNGYQDPQASIWQGQNARPQAPITGPDSVDPNPRQPTASRASGT